ncbi:MAG: response regulator [Armatimonadota bacterium]|jgi:AmiR/NasT family two-component response regulator
MDSLRILIADDESIIRLDLKNILLGMGHNVVAEASDGRAAVELARSTELDLAVLDIKMPEMDGLDAAKIITDEQICPVLLLTAYSQRDLIDRAKEAGVFGYLVKPFKETDLLPAIEIAISRYREMEALSKEVGSLQEKMEARKIIDRAKGVLMDKRGMKEQDAFRWIQMQAMSSRKSMREIAEAVILTQDV